MSTGKGIFLASLVASIVYLAANQLDGWGWLVVVLIFAL